MSRPEHHQAERGQRGVGPRHRGEQRDGAKCCADTERDEQRAAADSIRECAERRLNADEDGQRDEVDPRHLFLRQAGRVDHELLHVGGERVEGDGAAEGQAHDGQALSRIREQDSQAAALGVLL